MKITNLIKINKYNLNTKMTKDQLLIPFLNGLREYFLNHD